MILAQAIPSGRNQPGSVFDRTDGCDVTGRCRRVVQCDILFFDEIMVRQEKKL